MVTKPKPGDVVVTLEESWGACVPKGALCALVYLLPKEAHVRALDGATGNVHPHQLRHPTPEELSVWHLHDPQVNA